MYSNYTFFFSRSNDDDFSLLLFIFYPGSHFSCIMNFSLIMNHMQYQSPSECLWLYTVTSHSCERVQLETNSAYEIYYSQLDLF